MQGLGITPLLVSQCKSALQFGRTVWGSITLVEREGVYDFGRTGEVVYHFGRTGGGSSILDERGAGVGGGLALWSNGRGGLSLWSNGERVWERV